MVHFWFLWLEAVALWVASIGSRPTSAAEWVQATAASIAALGTFVAVLLALFQRSVQGWLYRPSLRLRLLSETGELVAQHSGSPRRYYHLELINEEQKSPVSLITVSLIRVEGPKAAGLPVEALWRGDVPLTWQWDLPHHREGRTVGPSAIADLYRVGNNEDLTLTTEAKSTAFGQWTTLKRAPPGSVCSAIRTLFLQARGIEGSSNILAVDVEWDGCWDDDDLRMAQHLRIAERKSHNKDT